MDWRISVIVCIGVSALSLCLILTSKAVFWARRAMNIAEEARTEAKVSLNDTSKISVSVRRLTQNFGEIVDEEARRFADNIKERFDPTTKREGNGGDV